MTKVRIIGGGLTGILAAFEAHRLGAREIILEDALDRLGGWSLPRVSHGVELRDGEFAFGAAQDPIRRVLEWHGVAFDDVDLHVGAVSPSPSGPQASWSAGPVLTSPAKAPCPDEAETLNDLLRAYPRAAADPLAHYCQWRLGVWLDQIHASAAPALGLDQVRLVSPGEAIAPNISVPASGATPRDGLNGLFSAASRALARLGVQIRLHSLVSPREAAVSRAADDIVVWAADPLPLFDLTIQPRPRLIGERVASYVYRARIEAPLPLTIRNYTADGKISALRVYESRGETLVSIECVDEVGDAELRAEALRLLGPFARRPMMLEACLLTNMRTRFTCPSTEAVTRLARLEGELDRLHKGRFLIAGWESADAPARISALADRLGAVMGAGAAVSAVA